MTDNNELYWGKPEKIHLGFVKKLRLAVNTNKDDIKIEELLNTPIMTQLNDCLFENKQSSNKTNDIKKL